MISIAALTPVTSTWIWPALGVKGNGSPHGQTRQTESLETLTRRNPWTPILDVHLLEHDQLAESRVEIPDNVTNSSLSYPGKLTDG